MEDASDMQTVDTKSVSFSELNLKDDKYEDALASKFGAHLFCVSFWLEFVDSAILFCSVSAGPLFVKETLFY